jgi:hypothetical protein
MGSPMGTELALLLFAKEIEMEVKLPYLAFPPECAFWDNPSALAKLDEWARAYASQAVLAERERCALICDGITIKSAVSFGYRHGAEKCAAAIRLSNEREQG